LLFIGKQGENEASDRAGSLLLWLEKLQSGTGMEHGCNIIVAIGCFMSYIRAMNVVLFALPLVVALAFAALTIRREMR
jgi:hypothetical protein